MSTQVRYSLTTLAEAKIDAESGVIRDVAIMTEGEALGHGMRVDVSTLQKLYALAGGGGVKAFLNHSMMPAPTEAVGIFSGFYIDKPEGEPAKLRAAFKALRAFREHSPKEYATLFELAADAPNAFGVSVSIWQDIEDAEDGGLPFIRPTAFESADFVSTPAANKSLFSKTALDVSTIPIQDVSTNKLQAADKPAETKPKPSRTVKAIFAKYSANPQHLQRAVKFMAENEGATEEKAIEETDKAISAEEVEALKASVASLTKERDELLAKLTEANTEKEALSAPAAEAPGLKEQVAKLSAERDEAQRQVRDMTSRLARYGVSPLKLSTKTDEKPAAETKTITRAEFAALDPVAQGKHFEAGGKVTE